MLGDLSSDARKAFWGHVSRLEPWRDHPTIKNSQWDQLVGISIHGDGCEIYREDEFFVWSWSSTFISPSLKDVLIRRYPIAVIPERQMRKSSVLQLYFINCFLYWYVSLFAQEYSQNGCIVKSPFAAPGSQRGAQDRGRGDFMVTIGIRCWCLAWTWLSRGATGKRDYSFQQTGPEIGIGLQDFWVLFSLRFFRCVNRVAGILNPYYIYIYIFFLEIYIYMRLKCIKCIFIYIYICWPFLFALNGFETI